jgi:hypothetical protein
VQPEAPPFRDQPHEGVVGLSDLFGQLLDIAASEFCIDARSAGILQLDFDSL